MTTSSVPLATAADVFAPDFPQQLVQAARTLRAAARGAGAAVTGQAATVTAAEFDFVRQLLGSVAGGDNDLQQALELHQVAREVPASVQGLARLAVRAGGALSLGMPWVVMPLARKLLRERVEPLILTTKLPHGVFSETVRAELRPIREAGQAIALRPLGDIVHGPAEAAAEVARLSALVNPAPGKDGLPASHPATHIVVDPARLAPAQSAWGIAAAVQDAAVALRELLASSAESGVMVLLRPESVEWTLQLPQLVEQAFASASAAAAADTPSATSSKQESLTPPPLPPGLARAQLGVYLPLDLPDSALLYRQLHIQAQQRVAAGGAASEAVFYHSGFAAAARVQAVQDGLPLPVLTEPEQVYAQALRLLHLVLQPGRAVALKPVLASEDSFLLAAAAAFAEQAGCAGLWGVELRRGVVPGLADAAAALAASPSVRVSVAACPPAEPRAIARYLTGLAAAVAASAEVRAPELTFIQAAQDFLAKPQAELRSQRVQRRAREWDPSERDSALFYRPPEEPAKFDTGGLTTAVLGLHRNETGELRLQELAAPRAIPVVSETGLACEPETDMLVAENRQWVRDVVRRGLQLAIAEQSAPAAASAQGKGSAEAPASPAAAQLPQDTASFNPLDPNVTVALARADLTPLAVVSEAVQAGAAFGQEGVAVRVRRLRRAALAVVAARDKLLAQLVADTGYPPFWLDAEINTIADAARYTAILAEQQAVTRGAEFVPHGLLLVAADVSAPFGVQAGAVLAGVAAGGAVLWAVPQRLAASATALVEEWQAGGLPAGVVRVEGVAVGSSVPKLAAAGVQRAVVFGAREFARSLARSRPDMRIDGWCAASGSALVTAAADVDLAVRDVAASAFSPAAGFGGVQALVLLGGAARNRRFREGLCDAVRALRVGDARLAARRSSLVDPVALQVGPLAAPPTHAQLRALTELAPGEEWWVEPRQLDEAGLLWQPGIRAGVAPDSWFWDAGQGVPVLGVSVAHTFGEACNLQNRLGGGGVAALFSRDAAEVQEWVDSVDAARLVVNHATVPARMERHPQGGWGSSQLGFAVLQGGPNWLFSFGSWVPRTGTRSETLHLRGLRDDVRALISAAQGSLRYEEFDLVRRAALADELAWNVDFGRQRDVVGLGAERNFVRYLPVPTHLRFAEDAQLADAVRVLAAGLRAGAEFNVSTGLLLPDAVLRVLSQCGVTVALERDEQWLERLAASRALGELPAGMQRIRLVGGDAARAAEWLGGLDGVPLWGEPVTMAGPVELLTLLREQAVSEALLDDAGLPFV